MKELQETPYLFLHFKIACMEKNNSSLLAAIGFFIVTSSSAQNWVNGGNTLSANGSIGIKSNYTLIFKTNNVDRGRITNTGNWAFGSTGTSSRLTVNSTSGVSPLRAQVSGATKFLVNGNGGTTIGSSTAGPANGLYVAGSTGIGTPTPSSLYKLQVAGTIYGSNPSYIGVYGSSSSNYGVYGISDYIGVSGYSYSNGWGIYGYGANAIYGLSPIETGVAIWGDATANAGIGVFGYSKNYIGVYGSTTSTGQWAGYFAGKVYSSGGYTSSDRKLKENIEDVGNAMQIIASLKPRTYKYRQDGNYKLMNLPQGQHYGLVAQEVEEVLPELVVDAEFNTGKQTRAGKQEPPSPNKPPRIVIEETGEIINFKTLNYTELIPIVVKALQEQQQLIDKLIKQNEEQQKHIERLENRYVKSKEVQIEHPDNSSRLVRYQK